MEWGKGVGIGGGGDGEGAVLIRNCKSSFLLLKSKTINKTQNIVKRKHDNK